MLSASAWLLFSDGALFRSLNVGENVRIPARQTPTHRAGRIAEVGDGLSMIAYRHRIPTPLRLSAQPETRRPSRAIALEPEIILYA